MDSDSEGTVIQKRKKITCVQAGLKELRSRTQLEELALKRRRKERKERKTGEKKGGNEGRYRYIEK